MLPSTEPSATMTVSASSSRYPRTRPPESRPNAAANSPAIRGMASSASRCLACMRYRTSMNASGPTIAPIVTGSAGIEHLARGERRQEGVDRLLLRDLDAARRRA